MKQRAWLRIHREDALVLKRRIGGATWKAFMHELLNSCEAIAPVSLPANLPRSLDDSDRASIEIYPDDRRRISAMFPSLESHQVGFLLAEMVRESRVAA